MRRIDLGISNIIYNMEELILREYVSIERLNNVINNAPMDSDKRKILKKYRKGLRQVKHGDNCIAHVKYEKKLIVDGVSVGRRYAEKSLSLQNFEREIRWALCYDDKIDIDIVNAHPVLISQYCLKNNIPCPSLKEYVDCRDALIQGVVEKCGVSRDVVKDMVYTILYLGSSGSYCANSMISEAPPTWVDKLETEMKQVAQAIAWRNPNIFEKLSKSKKKEHMGKDTNASCLSYVVGDIEDKIIMAARSKLTSLGFCVETLCFDGMLISKADLTEDHIEEVQAHCYATTGYNVRFVVKPMQNTLEIEEAVYDFSGYEFEHREQYNQLYCSQLRDETEHGTYALRKTYIELFATKIMCPDACFIFEMGYEDGSGYCKDPLIYSIQAMSNLLKPIQSGILDDMGKPTPFFPRWLQDAKQRVYRTYDFCPFSTTLPPQDIFNLFKGYNPDCYTPPGAKKCLDIWFELVKSLCGDEDANDAYFHAFIAQMIQTPQTKPPVAIVIKGNQGTGKNMVLDTIGRMIGEKHYITSSEPNDFFGNHAEGFFRKLLVNLNEAEAKNTFNLEGRMKSFITEDTITINQKHVQPAEVKNTARVIITSNQELPLTIDVKSKERRWVVFESSDRFLNMCKGSDWAKMATHFRKPAFISALYHHYMEMDVSKINWTADRPITNAYRALANRLSPAEALFLEDYIDNRKYSDQGWSKEGVENKDYCVPLVDMYREYKTFLKENAYSRDAPPSPKVMVGKMLHLNIPFLEKKKHNLKHVIFNPKEVYDHMTKMKWINCYGGETEKEGENPGLGGDFFAF